MTPDERERIEAAVREAVKSITGFSDGPLVPQLLAKFHEHLAPAIDALLAARDAHDRVVTQLVAHMGSGCAS